MIFCQFANSTSVRDISNGLRSATGNLNHLGIREAPSKSTVAYQNRHRSSNVFKEIYYACLEHLGQHTFGKRKKGDNTAAKQIPVDKGTVVVSDRYYCDFELLNYWDSNGVFFVVRHKSNLSFRKVKENDLPPVRHQNVLIDEIVELTGTQTSGKYRKQLRRVVVYNEEKGFTVELLTNNFNWTALITILMLKYLQFRASYDWNLSNLVASLRLNTFTKMDLWKWLNEPFTPPPDTLGNPNEGVQLSFF